MKDEGRKTRTHSEVNISQSSSAVSLNQKDFNAKDRSLVWSLNRALHVYCKNVNSKQYIGHDKSFQGKQGLFIEEDWRWYFFLA